jgi:general secretion pathway protein F
MAKFIWLGLNSRGEIRQYDLVAARYADARQEAAQRAASIGLEMVEVRAVGKRGEGQSGRRISLAGLVQRDRFDLSLFACELLALLRAGLALTEALDTLVDRQRSTRSDNTPNDRGQHILSALLLLMHQGRPFSAALAAHPEQFSRLFVAMISASERTGEMPQALERYLHYHGQVAVLRQKLISASLYPTMLLLAGSMVAFFLIWFLAPRFGHVYEGMTHAELPLMSRWLIGFGLLVSDHTTISMACLTSVIGAVAAIALRPSVQQRCLASIAHIAWIGDTLKLMQMARFYRSVGMLLHGGVPLLSSLEMTRDLLPPAFQAGLARSIMSISEGKTLSESLQQETLLTPIALRLLRAGERNGQIAGMLAQAALFHEREVSLWVDRLARLIEPILMLVMGIGIGAIVVLLYLPIFDLAGSLQ